MLLPILICISGWVSVYDMQTIQRAAEARGYSAEYHETGIEQRCDVLVVRSDAEWTKPGIVGFDDHNSRRDYSRRTLTQARAEDLMLAWGQYERDLIERKAAALGFVPDGHSDAYDFLSELPKGGLKVKDLEAQAARPVYRRGVP